MNGLNYVKELKKHVGAPYVYGAKQNKQFNIFYNKKKIKELKKLYPNQIWKSDLSKSVVVVIVVDLLIIFFKRVIIHWHYLTKQINIYILEIIIHL